MALFEVTTDKLSKLPQTTFDRAGLYERGDLQRLLRNQIDAILPDVLIISEEFGDWEDSRRRIDLLGIDRDANLVVVEIKRTEDGGHMELQAIRYAAMVSTMTFDKAVEVFEKFLTPSDESAEARNKLLDFLGWTEPKEDEFAQDVKIVLTSSNFSRELTTAVMWLNTKDLNIRCIRLVPYDDKGRTLLDVQTIIPLPEAEKYQVQIRDKEQRERKDKASRYSERKSFWEKFLANGGDRSRLHAKMKLGERSYMGASSGISGCYYYYGATQHESKVELYIDRRDWEDNNRIFGALYSKRSEIEARFGVNLSWHSMPEKRACRVAYEIGEGGYRDAESLWPEIHARMTDAMIRLDEAITPVLLEIDIAKTEK